MQKVLKINGMMCAHCVKHVGDALGQLGVKADVCLEDGTATVTGDVMPSDDALRAVISEAGYEVTEIK